MKHVHPVFSLVRKHGLWDFLRIIAGMADRRLFGFFFSRRSYHRCLRTGRPYFGEFLAARQGVRRRHASMARLVARESRTVDGTYAILEVGSYAGASAITFARAAQGRATVLCIDPWDAFYSTDVKGVAPTLEDMTEGQKSGKVFDLFQHNIRAAGVAGCISIRKGLFHDVAPSLPDASFDLIYIDGDHRHPRVRQDLELATRLLKPAGILCGDDLELQLEDVDGDFCRANGANDLVVDPRTRGYYHPGVTLSVAEFFGGRVSDENGFWAMKRAGTGWETIDLTLGAPVR